MAGSSRYFLEGAVTYSDKAKVKRLRVKQSSINKFGAVSEEVAKEMAEAITKTTGADIGISATGIAGPGGGSAEKPVGLVYIGLHIAGETKCRRKVYRFDRKANRERTVTEMLTWLYFELKGFKKV